jgi:hypothetical protein
LWVLVSFVAERFLVLTSFGDVLVAY